MNVLLIGSGGREHAIAKKIKESHKVTNFYAIPGNPGIASLATIIGDKQDCSEIVAKAQEYKVDLIVCGPEQPLVDGLADMAEAVGIKVFGPKKCGAIFEGSKIYSKQFMSKYDIPTSDYKVYTTYEDASRYIDKRVTYPVVIKADGLAAGKGVKIAKTPEEAHEALKLFMVDKIFGESGSSVVIEDFMTGEEMSALYITDSKTFLPLIAAKDYKRAFTGDEGDNTGGMGSYAPHNRLNDELRKEIDDKIIKQIRIGFAKENIDYRGVLYVGLMLTEEGPKVVEFNCRFGDPETQVILPLLENDILEVFSKCVNAKLAGYELHWKQAYSACVVLAAGGYPGHYEKGMPITFKNNHPYDFIHAGTKMKDDGTIVTSGGRVLNAVAVASSKSAALSAAYNLLEKVTFDGAFCRTDIGK